MQKRPDVKAPCRYLLRSVHKQAPPSYRGASPPLFRGNGIFFEKSKIDRPSLKDVGHGAHTVAFNLRQLLCSQWVKQGLLLGRTTGWHSHTQ